jgi:hypothetical protein
VVSTCWHYSQFWTNLQQATLHYVVQIRADSSARGIASMLVVRSPADTVIVPCIQQTTWQHSFQRCCLLLWIYYICLMAHIISFLNKSHAKYRGYYNQNGCQYSEMHFSFSLLRIKSLYMIITCSSSGVETQTALDILRACYVSWLCHDQPQYTKCRLCTTS